MKKHIYISGFMGTGKSTVGRLLANRLNLPYLDTDTAIETETAMTIAEIFSKKGGEESFRERERALLKRLGFLPPHVISLGGGMVLSLLNREIFRGGIWINLSASAATILNRIGSSLSRPLLGKKVKREDIEVLLKARQPYYDLAPYQVPTDGLSPEAVMAKALKIVLRESLK